VIPSRVTKALIFPKRSLRQMKQRNKRNLEGGPHEW
jgi:hypothetical protein